MWKVCENVGKDDQSLYCEWLSLATFSQPFHNVNALLLTHYDLSAGYSQSHLHLFSAANLIGSITNFLIQRGVQESRFLPGGELAIEDDQLVLRDSPQRVSSFL